MKKHSIQNKLEQMEKDFIDSLPIYESTEEDEKRTGLWYAMHIVQKAEYKTIASGGQIYVYYKGQYISLGGRAKTIDFVNKCLLKIDNILFAGAKLTHKVLEELYDLSTLYRTLLKYPKHLFH